MTPLQNYLEETGKEFEERYYDKTSPSGLNQQFIRSKSIVDDVKSFLLSRQLGLIELIKGLVPKKQREYSFDNQYFPECRGFNSCREQFLRKFEEFIKID